MIWWWPFLSIRYPWSGDVDVAPRTSWDLPFSGAYNAGDRTLERKIIENEAGYGRQLGILLDAVDQLLAEQPESVREKRASIELRELAQNIRARKKAHYQETLRGSLESYRDLDPEGFAALIAEFSERSK